MDQTARDKELLDITRDCFYFVTKFFEPINLSAVHIYHSALELCPLSSIVRRLYYHQRHIAFPRVVAGIPDSWSETVSISSGYEDGSVTWSPCSQFVAAVFEGAVEIRDALSSELVSRFTEPDTDQGCGLAYSPDGQSLAYLSNTLVIWDTQTGGAAKEIQYNESIGGSIVWSLDGKMVGMTKDKAVHVYDVTLGTTWSPGTLQSMDALHLWAHGRIFQIMATEMKDQVLTINIFEVGLGLTKVESFPIGSWGQNCYIRSFSPTNYRISFEAHERLCILDILNSELLLNSSGGFDSHCFSSDGSLFAAVQESTSVHIWKYISGHYTHWRKFITRDYTLSGHYPLRFSPALQSILGRFDDVLQVYHLDSPPVTDHCNTSSPYVVLSPCGTYMVTANKGESTVTITNLLLQITPQFINTDLHIQGLVLTGNVLSVLSHRTLRAWRLTSDGLVDGVLRGQEAGHHDSIWTVPASLAQMFTLKDQIVITEDRWNKTIVHAYHSVTGELLEPQPHYDTLPSGTYWYCSLEMSVGKHYPHYHDLHEWVLPESDGQVSKATLQEGWVTDSKGKHLLWVPIEWRISEYGTGGWLSDITALWLFPSSGTIIIIFQ